MSDLLFIYGTLLKDDNEHAVYLKNNSTFYSAGKLKGKLYDIGEYPEQYCRIMKTPIYMEILLK